MIQANVVRLAEIRFLLEGLASLAVPAGIFVAVDDRPVVRSFGLDQARPQG